jgi:hypothetical protein
MKNPCNFQLEFHFESLLVVVQNICNDVPYIGVYNVCGIYLFYLQKPLNHMPNVVKIITERASELAALDKVVYYFSARVSLILYSSIGRPTA